MVAQPPQRQQVFRIVPRARAAAAGPVLLTITVEQARFPLSIYLFFSCGGYIYSCAKQYLQVQKRIAYLSAT